MPNGSKLIFETTLYQSVATVFQNTLLVTYTSPANYDSIISSIKSQTYRPPKLCASLANRTGNANILPGTTGIGKYRY
jgi:hypothetical protein